MSKILILIVTIFACAGCGGVAVNSSKPSSKYNKLIVRDINWKETATSDITVDQMKEFISSQPMLNELFRAEFDKNIRKTGAFDVVVYGNALPDADTLTLVPKIYTLKPIGFMPGASFTGFLLSADGKLLGTYSEERRLNSTSSDPEKIKCNIEKLVRELGEDAASKLPYAP
ncbi:MAG: hypothetical protein EHM79_08195 [Geobacter sp.]|nr:MAG: hypothetical protein EHM79_08195 [Geobacter sp.]